MVNSHLNQTILSTNIFIVTVPCNYTIAKMILNFQKFDNRLNLQYIFDSVTINAAIYFFVFESI